MEPLTLMERWTQWWERVPLKMMQDELAKIVEDEDDTRRRDGYLEHLKSLLPRPIAKAEAALLNESFRKICAKIETDQQRSEFENQVVEAVFDLGVGPVRFASGDISPAEIDHKIFVNPKPPDAPAARPLQDFADRICKSPAADGVYCVSGPRGSGKSSALNFVAHRAMNPGVGNEPALVVRFDVGAAFDPKAFTIDLLAETCRAVEEQCKLPCHSSRWSPNWMRKFVGLVGRACDANRRWAVTVLLLALVLSALQGIRKGISPTQENLPTGSATSSGESKELDWKTEVCVVGTLCVVIGAIGVSYSIAGVLSRRWPKRLRNVNPWLLLLAVVVTGGLVDWEVFLRMSEISAMAGVIFDEGLQRAISGMCGATAALCLGMFLLPNWWWHSMECANLRRSLRAKANSTLPELNLLKQLGGVLELLLPQSPDVAEARDMDLPFLQERVKALAQSCVTQFERVIILVDDVDVLPSSRFHELFRVLRPLGKVSGVRAVVSVPSFFYDVLAGRDLCDVHSTVRQVLGIGWQALEDFSKGKDNSSKRKIVIEQVMSLLKRRSRNTALAEGDIFNVIKERWEAKGQIGTDAASIAHLERVLRVVEYSRREIIRESARLLADRYAKPFDQINIGKDREAKDAFISARARYIRAEQALSRSPEDQHALEIAIKALGIQLGDPPRGGGE